MRLTDALEVVAVAGAGGKISPPRRPGADAENYRCLRERPRALAATALPATAGNRLLAKIH
jgi:hypothetical protein